MQDPKALEDTSIQEGQLSDPTNYRPISLTCISCKLMEHIVTSSIMHHAQENDILYDLQHGFHDRRSCETQLNVFVSDVVNNMQRGKQTDVLIMDFPRHLTRSDTYAYC